MIVTSQNGYTANDRTLIASYTIPRTQQKISLRKGDTSVILLDLLGWIHLHVEPLDVGIFDDWGYAERTIRGDATTLSNHASGTAADANATQHPLGVRGTWTDAERARINARLALYEGCVRWGDNYSGRVDGMHFEINRGATDCRRIADRIRAGQLDPAAARPVPAAPVPAPPPPPPPEEDEPVYIKCQPVKDGPVSTALLAGPFFVGLVGSEVASADDQIAKGARVQWVSVATWGELDKRSHALCDNPRPVQAVNPTSAHAAQTGA